VTRLQVFRQFDPLGGVQNYWGVGAAMANAVARAYNGGLAVEPLAGIQGAELPVMKPTSFFRVKNSNFQSTYCSFARNDVLFELLLLCSGLWIHSIFAMKLEQNDS